MADATATRPARTRAARTTKATPAKAAPAKATKATTKPPAEASEPEEEFYYVDLVQLEDTKSYSVFAPPDEMKGVMVGKLYVPHGTEAVKVRISGPKA